MFNECQSSFMSCEDVFNCLM